MLSIDILIVELSISANIVSPLQYKDEFAVATNVIGEVNNTFPLFIFDTIAAR